MKPPCAACPTGIKGDPCPPKCVRKVRREAAQQLKFDEHGEPMSKNGMNRSEGIRRQASGDFGEAIAKHALESAGIRMVEKVNSCFTLIRRMGRIVGAFPAAKVSGDYIGIGPHGKKVLAEVKYRPDSLSLSDFEEHQRDALEVNHQFGGISLVVWVRKHEYAIYYWPQMVLEKGSPYKPGDKRGLQLSNTF
jgi:hypothetical protein